MLEVVNYTEGNMLTIGKTVRNALNLRKGQSLFIYEDVRNKRVVITPYKVKSTLYNAIIMFDKMEEFHKLSLELAQKGADIVVNRIHRCRNGWVIHLIYSIPETINLEEWRNGGFSKVLRNIVEKYPSIHIFDIYWFNDRSVQKPRDVFRPMIKLSDNNLNIPRQTKLSNNWNIWCPLSEDFKRAIGFNGHKISKCVQFVELDSCRIIMTFHSSKVKKVRIKHLNMTGSFIRLLFILNALNLKLEANISRIIDHEQVGLIEDLCALNYSSIDAPKNEFNDAKSLCQVFIETDHKLAETNEDYKKLKSMHDELLFNIGKDGEEFIKECKFI